MGICGLCGEEKELLKSHFVPKFATDWIKKTSATGYLRQMINKNKRVQDGKKEKFLCKDCELKFSKYESYFAKNIFHPYMSKAKTSFRYDENLQKFIISVSWRLLKGSLEKLKKSQPEMLEYAKETEEKWREILLNDEIDQEHEHHLFLWDYIETSSEGMPDKFQAYMMRGVDGTPAGNKKELFLFSKIPSIFFVSSIYPKRIQQYWDKTLIEKKGILSVPQTCSHPGFGDFLFGRAKIGNKQKLTQRQNDKIRDTMLKDLERVRKSKTFELWEEEKKFNQNP